MVTSSLSTVVSLSVPNRRIRSIVNEAAKASPVEGLVNMGQGFFGYNPPQFVIDAAKSCLGIYTLLRAENKEPSLTRSRPCRLQPVLSDQRTSQVKEGHIGCLFAVLWSRN